MNTNQVAAMVQEWQTAHTPVAEKGQSIAVEDYCVGGIVCKFLSPLVGIANDREPHFPTPSYLAQMLLKANPGLECKKTNCDCDQGYLCTALRCAVYIIDTNDRELFDEAWSHVVAALTYTEGE